MSGWPCTATLHNAAHPSRGPPALQPRPPRLRLLPIRPGSPIACRDHRFTQAVVSISAPIGDRGQTMAEKTQKSVKIAPGAVVCVESEIRGDVTIGPRTVIHPKARIIAEAGPIVIGEGNLIEEQALIINAICRQKCDIDKRLHHRGLLQPEYV
uniref:Dynactin subunit 6 n=1 Tax=Equus asinus TaxID=9793 RepID=A0A9L0IDE2_EQUAS